MKHLITRFLNRFKIKYKFIIVVLPFLLISYFIIGAGAYLWMYCQTKDLITSQAEQNIMEKVSLFDSYMDDLLLSTDKLLYAPTMQRALQIEQAALSQEEYLALKDTMQSEIYDYFTKGDNSLYDVNIRNVYLMNDYHEFIVTDALYSYTLGNVRMLIQEYEPHARRLHGKVYLANEKPNHLYFVRTIYQGDIDHSDDQIGMIILDLNLRFFSEEIIANNVNDNISFALLDNQNQVVSNPSGLSDENCSSLVSNSSQRFDGNTYKGITHESAYSGYKIIGIINESGLYHDFTITFILVMLALVLSIVIIFCAIVFASNTISQQFQQFIKRLNDTDSFGEQALIRANSHDEFRDLTEVYNQMLQRVHTLTYTVYEKEISIKNAEIKAFQAQINPHFLYNTLDCINSLVGMGKTEETQKTVTALGNIMRMTIKGPDMVTIQQDVDFINQYLFIQKMRHQDKILFLVDIPPELYSYRIPKLILQPLVENAVIHGVSDLLGQGMIAIIGREKEDGIRFYIRDNGKGMDQGLADEINCYTAGEDPHKLSKKSSIGLLNIQHRLKLLYGAEYGLAIHRLSNGGTEITVNFPKQN